MTMQLRVDKVCTLTGSSSIIKDAVRSRLTIKNPKYDAAVRYGRWVGKNLKPKLYFFTEKDGKLIFPRGFANQAVLLCREHDGCSPEIIDKRRRLAESDFTFSGELRPYQQKAVGAALDHSFGVIEAGTGSGKTVMALDIIVRRQQPTLVLVHSKELLKQWQERIEQFLGVEAGQAGGGRVVIRPITVGIVNTVRRRIGELAPFFGHLVVDECHRVPASLFTDVVSGFDCWFMLGLSATAFRREDGMTNLIYTYLGDRVYSLNSALLMDSGAIVRPEFIQNKTAFSYKFDGEYGKMIKVLTLDDNRNNRIVADIVSLLNNDHFGTILVVSDRIVHCEVLEKKLEPFCHDVALLTGQTHSEKREKIVARVREGKVKVLISTLQLIGEGFDCPGLATVVLATPIKFEGRLLQVIGRVMRPADGKKATVIDYADVNVPVLFRSAINRLEIFKRWAGGGRCQVTGTGGRE